MNCQNEDFSSSVRLCFFLLENSFMVHHVELRRILHNVWSKNWNANPNEAFIVIMHWHSIIVFDVGPAVLIHTTCQLKVSYDVENVKHICHECFQLNHIVTAFLFSQFLFHSKCSDIFTKSSMTVNLLFVNLRLQLLKI